MIDQTSQFFAILTNVGAAKQANADVLGIPWKITQMAVGDANLTDPIPSAAQTKLVNERRRAPLNQLKVDPANSAILIAEQVIPAEIGGFWIREIGLYDTDGDLVAVANCAPSFKPLLTQGSGRTQVVRVNLLVSNASNVELKIDPSVVLATRAYVDQKVLDELNKLDFKHSVLVATTGPIVLRGLQVVDTESLPEGARVLVKDQAASKENGPYVASANAWVRTSDADTSAEVTPGLFVHVEKGAKNHDTVWQLVTDAPIVLGTTDLAFEMAVGPTGVNAGTYRSLTVDKYGRVVAGTNPTTIAGYGITDAYTKAQVDSIIAQASALPVGAMVSFPAISVPPGFLELDGSVKSIAVYPDLSAYFGTSFNKGDEGVGNFRLPESRGEFLRGWDHGRGVDAGRAVGSYQLDAMQSVVGSFDGNIDVRTASGPFGLTNSALVNTPGSAVFGYHGVSFDLSKAARTSTETRGRNLAVMWCIKAWNAPINQGNIDIAALVALAAQATEINQGTAKVATQALTDAGIDDTTIVTPKKLRAGFAASFTQNGYLALPSWLGGLIFQWGTVPYASAVAANTEYSLTTNYPIAFPNAAFIQLSSCRDFTASAGGGTANVLSNARPNGTGLTSVNINFRSFLTGVANSLTFNFFAVGK